MTGSLSDLVGHSLGPLRLDRVLGQGGFSWVFAGQEPDGTPVAVKVLKPRYAKDPEFEARFRREGETGAQLEHPNIVHIRSIAKTDEHVYFTMDLYSDTLAARLTREGPLPEPALVRLASDIALGLGFAHARGFVHRDLKPENILFSNGRAVITDFGIARALSGVVASTGVDVTLGTPQYLSPEQAQGRTIDHRADFYSLGVTLYKAATGDLPFTHPEWFELARMHVEDEAPPLREKRPSLSRGFEQVVARCLAKHPDDRYQEASELFGDLAAVERGGEVGERTWIEKALGPRDQRAVRVAIGIGLVLLLVFGLKLLRR
ncbi:MAG TPA: serine/threonine-protein kinase [Gemmatimonadales bacterium]|nr:serine/threonine-protein kinase [Gemmatimonadales bacterium]